MPAHSQTQKYVSAILYLTINALFYFKYLYRISLAASIVSVILYLAFSYFLLQRYYKNKPLQSDSISFILIIGYTVLCGVVLYFIPKEGLNVDRWEMIQVFWDAVANNQYPYAAQGSNGNYPGPMPFYFILAYPFYRIGEIGFMALTGVLLWLYYIYTRERRSFAVMVLLLFSSLAIYWEIFARSTIFFNTCLFTFFLFSLRDLKNKSTNFFYLSAIIGGILISTRNVFVIVLILWGMYILLREKIEFSRLFRWGICFILAFAVTFIPFICMDPQAFLKMNPFIIQSSVLMPFGLVLFFIVLAFILSFRCRKFSDVIYYSGLMLFLTITGHVVYVLYESGIDAYLNAGADISYYIFCFPFLLKTMTYRR